MSETSTPHRAPRQGLLSTLLSWIGAAAGTLLVSLLFSLVTEWVGMVWLWPEQGAQHSQQMMLTELGWFAENVRRSLLMADPVALLGNVLQHIWQWLLREVGLERWLVWLRDQPEVAWLHGLSAYLQAAAYIVMTFVLRVFILLLTAPLFLLAALAGFTDGLVRRDIRRFGCGYESGFVYHHAKRTVMPVFWLAWIVYLSLPFPVVPWIILLPAAFLFGLSISIATGSFKKFL